jgi:hypothetical protein
MPREKNVTTPGNDLSDKEILEKAIMLVKENAPEYRDLIGTLAATAQSLTGLRPNFGLNEQRLDYTDRPEAIAKTVLDGLRYHR